MITKVVLASKSIVRKKILRENGIDCDVMPANVDEETVKKMTKLVLECIHIMEKDRKNE